MTDDDLSLDRLTADVSVFQRKKGHRFSSDDMVTAWTALQEAQRDKARLLDAQGDDANDSGARIELIKKRVRE